jgi:uncharacterized membrane protein YesL
MKNLFNYDGAVFQFLMKFCSACGLGLMWTICSLPLFTIGASTTALYAVSIKLVRGTEGTSIVRQFLHAFRTNFRQATQLWLIVFSAGAFLAADCYILYHLRQSSAGTAAVVWTLLFAVVLAAVVLYSIVFTFLFPMLAYFDNDNRSMLRNSFFVGARYLFCTIAVFGIHAAFLYVTINLFAPLLLFGEGLSAWASSYLLSNVLLAVSGEKRGAETEDSGDEP